MNWTECRVHSTAAHAISIEIAQTPLPHTPSTRTEFIKVSCGAIITIPLLANPSIYSGTCAWFTITFTMVIVTLLSTDSPRCHVYNACNATQGRSYLWGRHGSHKLLPKWPNRRAINVKSPFCTVVQDIERLNTILRSSCAVKRWEIYF